MNKWENNMATMTIYCRYAISDSWRYWLVFPINIASGIDLIGKSLQCLPLPMRHRWQTWYLHPAQVQPEP